MNFQAGLYIVSTPIGNLGDITLRALKALQSSDIILCEDTRVSNKLLAKHDIKGSLKVYNDKSDAALRDFVKTLILEGKVVSLVSDAGTPLISDPGYKLVRELKLENIHVDVIPGACAIIAALTLSGLPTDRFLFSGFLPKTKEGKKKVFEELLEIDATLVFYETSNRLLQSLKVALETFGDREANVARELTKLYQESRLSKLSELIAYYEEKPPRGEVVFSVSGKAEQVVSESIIEEQILLLLAKGQSAKTASDTVFAKYKGQFSRKFIYQLTNRLK
ncbi:MAG: 16S rRNA (cytidine(1402)-2'-O)-methyltransferase [Rickettsiaceae bacterium]|nr:16S rRNA (cytidine(1402)-2'-O)-methyltransferase [Rickettsiaceae bacterium]MDP4832905.1 16S rRNA (cytidine(1402)-2'-O)-methyltransferase [Rickettsiaceae bacterium]MDP5021134.1 16S rRNA (cytidine(1402)-2'-O)-methyltransferase [Rickettsiaceae bacterium]MDP5082702.1 16S rRNA (cytidine(1402)-2'-O)-methyltransferase [Rickettsiaceae bacterium]